MKRHGWGRIVTNSSISAYGVGINGAHYAASKGPHISLSPPSPLSPSPSPPRPPSKPRGPQSSPPLLSLNPEH